MSDVNIYTFINLDAVYYATTAPMVKKLSPYAKEDSEYRMTVEYRCTRKRTFSNSFPMSGRSKTSTSSPKLTDGSRPIQSPIQLVLEVLSLGVKQLRLKGDHSNLSSVKVQNNWSNTSIPSYAVTAYTRTTLPLPLLHTTSTAKVGLTMLL